MIYALLCWEFLQIGLFAVGGGLVTVPFLFNLAEEYAWFSARELADMIAVSQSTPGPVGINMATYAGYKTAGIGGSLAATFSIILPSLVIIYIIARMLNRWACNQNVQRVLGGIRPAVLALILYAGWDIAKVSVFDYKTAGLLAILVTAMHFYRKSQILYIALSAVVGIILRI